MNTSHTLTALLLVLGVTLPIQAQNNRNPLRDSLAKATDALAYHPDSIDLRLKKAAWNVELGQWQYAKDEYDIVLQHQPNSIAALYYRAYVNGKLHRYNFARLDYERLLEMVPGNFEAQLGLALLNQKDRHYTEAMDGINRLVAAFPDSASAWAARAGIEQQQDMLEPADYDFTEALKRDPQNADYLLSRADVRIRLRRFGQARRDLDAIVKLGTPRLALREWYDRCK